jgi:mono/diheme cytochrome c family protein
MSIGARATLNELLLIVITAIGLFAMVSALAFVLKPEPSAPGLPEPSTNVIAAVAAPDIGESARKGADLFARNCAHCHGDDARGDEGPSLYGLRKSDERITTIVKEGIKGEMPKFGSKFGDSDIQALIAYLRTLKE